LTPSRRTRAARTPAHQAVKPSGQIVWTPTVSDSTCARAEVTGAKAANEATATIHIRMVGMTSRDRERVNERPSTVDRTMTIE
jgi:hypothetical protein